MGGSGTSFSRFERENAGLLTRSAAERLKMRISGTAAITRGAAERAEPRAVGGDERVEIKEIF